MLLDNFTNDPPAFVPEKFNNKLISPLTPVFRKFQDGEALIQFFRGAQLHAAVVDTCCPGKMDLPLTGCVGAYGLVSLISGKLTLNASGEDCTLLPGISKLVDLHSVKITVHDPQARFSIVYWHGTGAFAEMTGYHLNGACVFSAEDQRVLTTSRALPQTSAASIYEGLLQSVVYRAYEQLEDRQFQLEHIDRLTREAIMLRRQFDLFFGRPKLLRAYMKDRKMSNLPARFRMLFQLNPHEYLTRTRLNYAKDLLIRTNLPMHEIAWEVGFESASAFNRRFTDELQTTPSNFRRDFKNGNHPIFPNESVKTTSGMPGIDRLQ